MYRQSVDIRHFTTRATLDISGLNFLSLDPACFRTSEDKVDYRAYTFAPTIHRCLR